MYFSQIITSFQNKLIHSHILLFLHLFYDQYHHFPYPTPNFISFYCLFYYHLSYILTRTTMHNKQSSNRKKVCGYVICLDKPLGEGATSKVYLSYKSDNPEQLLATKIINKSQIEDDEYMREAIRREFNIHSKLKHPNIVNLVEMHETVHNIYIFQEYCDGMTLKEVLRQRKKLDQPEVMFCLQKLCLGYSQLVNRGIIHRDLKPQNILISGQQLKIGDFGLSKQINYQKQFVTSIVGSPIYMAPQILKGEKYNSKCDVWSMGIIIFEMLYGHFPWHKQMRGPQNANSLLKILTEPLKIPEQPKVSEQLTNFIEECLQTDENERLSWLQVFKHPILSDCPQFSKIAENYTQTAQSAINLLNNLASSVKAYQLIGAFLQFKVKALDFNNFSIIMKNYLVPEATQTELSIMYEVFDKDCNGVIDLQEFVKAFQVCDESILKLLNTLIDKQDMLYENLKDWYLFSNTAKLLGFSNSVIETAYSIICQIQQYQLQSQN